MERRSAHAEGRIYSAYAMALKHQFVQFEWMALPNAPAASRASRGYRCRALQLLPKPSGVPVPSPSRSVPSRESVTYGLSGARELNVPKLRASSSRNQLRSAASNTGGRETPLRAPASRDQLRPTAGAKPIQKPLATKPQTSRVPSQPNRRTSSSHIRPPPCDGLPEARSRAQLTGPSPPIERKRRLGQHLYQTRTGRDPRTRGQIAPLPR
ncbi:hypothetical protein ACCO45_009060 [Purpureocillium lilacinum]|uniref:Uncharacterized protein n=1 Tax=Purpureocillium lilacinum TaxID=33203 RepID=A0ACC4DK26_PURLI